MKNNEKYFKIEIIFKKEINLKNILLYKKINKFTKIRCYHHKTKCKLSFIFESIHHPPLKIPFWKIHWKISPYQF